MKTLTFAILLGLFLACNNNPTKTDNTDKSLVQESLTAPTDTKESETVETDEFGFKIISDSVVIPAFEIELKLSEKAEAKLKNDNETIIVAAYFSATPNENLLDEDGDGIYAFLTYTIELSDKRLARLENLKFPKNIYDLMDDKDIVVQINVYSGRKSSEYNLLDCTAPGAPISEFKGKRHIVTGKLIYGE